MIDWIETGLAAATTMLLACAFTRPLRAYRSLFLGGAALAAITMLFPRPGNRVGQFLFAPGSGSMHLPSELFGIAWWVLGAWLIRSLLTLILRRTIFPNDYQPHARRLFADLASGMLYIVAFVGIMDTVLKQPISAFSGHLRRTRDRAGACAAKYAGRCILRTRDQYRAAFRSG